ncbi:hypothetical protein [Chryseobacterium kwangjuense]|uniref:Uncharacterized protein n=1 Tax=Chryseobacterium kwangjuense TaxID=267125 RepID=A0A135WJG6_9FLAO|nr:hypothetical protein [Chryseobacterium kwangjuense]KXH85015.1 hypothetical protein AU378_04475 [Chryseobacterium kwangjuense]
MFGVQIQEFHSVYLTVIAVLAILWLSYQWWRKEKRIKSLPKIIIIAVAGFIFYKLVFFTTTMVLFTGNTIKDHFFSEITEAQVIDFKAKKNIASKGGYLIILLSVIRIIMECNVRLFPIPVLAVPMIFRNFMKPSK